MVLDDGEDVVADVDELSLDLLLVVLDNYELVAFAFLLDGGYDTPGGTAGADDVLLGGGGGGLGVEGEGGEGGRVS